MSGTATWQWRHLGLHCLIWAGIFIHVKEITACSLTEVYDAYFDYANAQQKQVIYTPSMNHNLAQDNETNTVAQMCENREVACRHSTTFNVLCPIQLQGMQNTQRRDDLIEIQKVAQSIWQRDRVFEVDAPASGNSTRNILEMPVLLKQHLCRIKQWKVCFVWLL